MTATAEIYLAGPREGPAGFDWQAAITDRVFEQFDSVGTIRPFIHADKSLRSPVTSQTKRLLRPEAIDLVVCYYSESTATLGAIPEAIRASEDGVPVIVWNDTVELESDPVDIPKEFEGYVDQETETMEATMHAIAEHLEPDLDTGDGVIV